MPESSTATASVATATPDRYAKQLASHFGRRCEIRQDDGGIRIVFADGDCLLRPNGSTLDLRVTASGPAEAERLASVVGSHLERFGRRQELGVAWERP